MKRIANWITEKHKYVNTLFTILLVILTFWLILVTIDSTKATKNIESSSKIIANQEQVIRIQANVDLARDIIEEFELNDINFEDYYQKLHSYKNTDTHPMDIFIENKIKQANNKVGFGTESIRGDIRKYLWYLDLIKQHIKSINSQNPSSKNASIDKAFAGIEILRITGKEENRELTIVKKLNSYIEEQDSIIEILNTKINEELLQDK